ncbi:MAG: hypothetical protein KatS3mg111_1514 [Pirellulaceae bacterium]|nr:MAG: hypothetical protein KatS3mg111_1514 [Pirellulaceae bacterium]
MSDAAFDTDPVAIACRQRLLPGWAALSVLLGWALATGAAGHAQEPAAGLSARRAQAQDYFRKQVAPFIKSYCLECHQNRRPTEAGVNFSPALKDPGHAAFTELWKKAVARVAAHDMPPEDMEQPSEEQRDAFRQWLEHVKYLSPPDPGPFIIRRLTKREYGNTLRDLFGVPVAIAEDLPDEVSGEGYLNSVSPMQMEQFLEIANRVLDLVWPEQGAPPSEVQRRWLGDQPIAAIDSPEEVRAFAARAARQIYRRPASDDEIDVLMEVFALGKQNGLEDIAACRLMVKAMLVSPQFLFITPASVVASEQSVVPLDDYQLASRLSYFLWGTMPDDALMALADQGRLHEPATLAAQVTRMLQDPRRRAIFDGFGAQWLGVTDLPQRTFDAEQFPQMTAELRQSMYDEIRLVFDTVVGENRSLVELIDGDFTFLNADLAGIYGWEELAAGAQWQRVRVPDPNRGGVLGMPGVLAATSFPTRTSPVKRGVWVLERLLGEVVPSPPPDVPALENQDAQAVAHLTLRERTELHRTNPVCANCHRMLDPIGFGLENFDAIGRWRDADANGQPIDAAGELPDGTRFSGPRELKAAIASRREAFVRNFVRRLLAYALCRRLEGYDEVVVDDMMQEIAEDDYRMQTVIRAVVTSYPFTHRRIEEER